MTTIQLAYEVSAEAEERVRALLAEVARKDSNWNGVRFRIERADFTSIPGRKGESLDAIKLFSQIQAAIANQYDDA